MGLRKASAYSKKKARPYTRKSGVKNRAYIKTVPPSKIVKFTMGDVKGYNEKKHTYQVRLISEERIQIRDNALESCRMLINKILDQEIPGGYYLAIRVYPHHILRENKTAAGAGADRLSSGMKHSFGVTIGRAALVDKGKEIIFISCANERAARIAKNALAKLKSKVPCKTKITFEKIA
ncbi:MAG: 50S ribosomal protein L16 [Nanoarchaeota archaeon]